MWLLPGGFSVYWDFGFWCTHSSGYLVIVFGLFRVAVGCLPAFLLLCGCYNVVLCYWLVLDCLRLVTAWFGFLANCGFSGFGF